MDSRRGKRHKIAAERESTAQHAFELPPGSERDLLLDRAAGAALEIGNRAIRAVYRDGRSTDRASNRVDPIDYEEINASYDCDDFESDAPDPSSVDYWEEMIPASPTEDSGRPAEQV